MKDRDGLKSAISCGHGQRKGKRRSLLLDESDKPHGQQIAGVRNWTAESAERSYQIGTGLLSLGAAP
ncbi:MAG: hypothetical protein ACOYOS_15005 [Syntrophales bacterium]